MGGNRPSDVVTDLKTERRRYEQDVVGLPRKILGSVEYRTDRGFGRTPRDIT